MAAKRRKTFVEIRTTQHWTVELNARDARKAYAAIGAGRLPSWLRYKLDLHMKGTSLVMQGPEIISVTERDC